MSHKHTHLDWSRVRMIIILSQMIGWKMTYDEANKCRNWS